MSFTETLYTKFMVQRCIECDTAFAMAEGFKEARQRDKATFYCPNGHGQFFAKSKEAILREKLSDAERQVTFLKCQKINLETQNLKTEQKLNRLNKRVSAGVCTCCNRTFSNLARHRATKHPEKKK